MITLPYLFEPAMRPEPPGQRGGDVEARREGTGATNARHPATPFVEPRIDIAEIYGRHSERIPMTR